MKAIIADDETHIYKLIWILIDWESLGMEGIGTAANRDEALALIHRMDTGRCCAFLIQMHYDFQYFGERAVKLILVKEVCISACLPVHLADYFKLRPQG